MVIPFVANLESGLQLFDVSDLSSLMRTPDRLPTESSADDGDDTL